MGEAVKKVLVTGGDGQLGRELLDASPCFPGIQVITANRQVLNIVDYKLVQSFLDAGDYHHVINAAAYIAVDKAEKNPYDAMQANLTGASNLARATAERGIPLTHISTDFVFDGKKSTPYEEEDIPNPQGAYGRTKFYGEEAVLEHNPRSLVVRSSWLYSSYGSNFVKTILKLAQEKPEIKVVCDQIGSPTYAKDLAHALLALIPFADDRLRVLHYSNSGVASWYDFAKAVVEMAGLTTQVTPISWMEWPVPTKRPNYSVLSHQKLKQRCEIIPPYWRDSLRECVLKLYNTIHGCLPDRSQFIL